MRIVALCSPKGGNAKTHTTILLAVHAASLGLRVGIFDLNSHQPSLSNWMTSRLHHQKGQRHPEIIEVENLTRDVKVVAHAAQHDLLLIDTPPVIDDTAIVEGAVAVSNAVIVTCRPSMLDISTMDAMVEICKNYRKPFAFLLCDVTEEWAGINKKAIEALADLGPVMAARITHKAAYVNALTVGKTGPEIDNRLKTEVAALWSEVARLAGLETPPEASAVVATKRGRGRG